MSIITLTSDFGTRDYYVSVVKGTILRNFPGANIVDISHHIPPFDNNMAAFVVKNSFSFFPPGTVHILAINSELAEQTPHVAISYRGHYFIGADSGLFSLIFEEEPLKIIKLSAEEFVGNTTFPARDIFVSAACFLAKGGKLEEMGEELSHLNQRHALLPVTDKNMLRGSVIYIDSYGNVITNITRELFYAVGKDREFEILLSRGQYDINRISKSYNDVPPGEKLAMFNSAGYLQISINRGVEGSGGGASNLLGLRYYDSLRIEFSPFT